MDTVDLHFRFTKVILIMSKAVTKKFLTLMMLKKGQSNAHIGGIKLICVAIYKMLQF